MRPPTPVTTSAMARLRWSSFRLMSTARSPIHSQLMLVGLMESPPEARRMPKRITAVTKEMSTALMEICALKRREWRVNMAIIPAATSGGSRINQAKGSEFSNMELQFHGRQILDMRRLAFAIQCDDEREADGDFGGRDGDDEENDDLAV